MNINILKDEFKCPICGGIISNNRYNIDSIDINGKVVPSFASQLFTCSTCDFIAVELTYNFDTNQYHLIDMNNIIYKTSKTIAILYTFIEKV